MSSPKTIIDEHSLSEFRDTSLSPEAILTYCRKGGVTLLPIPMGVGKSVAIDHLLKHAKTFEEYDLVVYVAPTKKIISEREIIRKTADSLVPWINLTPRPEKKCGPLNEEWREFERQGCASFAKNNLCEICPNLKTEKSGTCTWPIKLENKIRNYNLIFCTEQHFINNPEFLLRLVYGSLNNKPLLILDEAKLINSQFETLVSASELQLFSEAVKYVYNYQTSPSIIKAFRVWLKSLNSISKGDTAVKSEEFPFPQILNAKAADIQAYGLSRGRGKFQYLGFKLALLPYSKLKERWFDANGTLHFISRPYVGTTALILSAHQTADYVKHRLNRDVVSPLGQVTVKHSGTSIYNLRMIAGADKYFRRNMSLILDFFASKILSNIATGKTTLLVSRKKFKSSSARYLRQRLKNLGADVLFPTKLSKKSLKVSPYVCPIIHYGMMGVNEYTDYESCYCINSYYIPSGILSDSIQGAEPAEFRIPLSVKLNAAGFRGVVTERRHQHSYLGKLANTYLNALEIDPVLQAAGRVRFHTKPREVIFFQTNDFGLELGSIEEFRTLADAYSYFNLEKPSKIIQKKKVIELRAMIAGGLSLRNAAKTLGISRSTGSRWLKALQEVSQNTFNIYISENGTPKKEKT